ncbi:LacI family DNA-binding transcriptional regulator [Streptomyces sp. NRRL F-5126]|uniref:LacI family DNA-binding transcriptional regulator n=1 Tax=Streptomyces sp. NRRL F-5126 TaxID=1463857 RepID=UPI0004C4C1F2|nr:LacI family DNA-binding transcriptional regulator [Streptomyces sp. NRRL F-5126]
MHPVGGGRRVTITDVARHAGVSTSAVSKVLRNAYGVSDAMRERVREAMDALDYRPHAAARGMRGRTYTIGVLLDNLRNAFFADILDGVNERLRSTDYQMLLGAAGFGAEDQLRLARAMVDRQMDGLILIGPGFSRAEVVSAAATVPTVVIGHHDTADAYDSVVDADAEGAALVVDHLVALGHRRIALTSAHGNDSAGWSGTPERVQRRGYREAMRLHGLDECARVATTAYSEEGGYRAGMELLAGPGRPTAVFAGADVAAMGVFRAARELGLRIPEDVSLAGYNNTAVAAMAPVRLTSVDQAGGLMGSTAARLLLERIDGRTRAVLMSVSPSLVVRGTTGPVPG